MTLDDLLVALGYKGSPQFLRRGEKRFASEPGFGHIFRRGEDKNEDESKKRWRVEGVYGLRDTNSSPERFVPIIYVCQADDESAANELHKKVWNQDVVPYVLVHEPNGVRVYAGFHYDAKGKTEAQCGIIQALTDFDQVESIIKLFEASAIDEGKIWQNSPNALKRKSAPPFGRKSGFIRSKARHFCDRHAVDEIKSAGAH
jgi:hypothetical protein